MVRSEAVNCDKNNIRFSAHPSSRNYDAAYDVVPQREENIFQSRARNTLIST